MSIFPFDYEGQQVNAVTIDDDGWLVGTDVARALGYANPSDALGRVHPDDKRTATLALGEGSRTVTRERTLLNESGVYFLVLGSTLDSARAFQRWITSEVLPSIRKRGGYLTPEATEAALTDPDFIIRLATELKAERAKRAELAVENQQQGARLRLVEPKAAAFDRWLSSNVDYAVGHVAKALAIAGAQIGRTRLFRKMADLHWIYRDGDQWTPYQTQIETGRLAVKLGTQLNTRTGVEFATVTVRITAKGVAKLAALADVMPETVAEALATTEEDAA